MSTDAPDDWEEDDPQELYYEDRSGAETDDRCGMEYFWQRKFGGLGIVPKEKASYFKIGAEIHEDLATIAELEDISPANLTTLIGEITSPITEEDRLVGRSTLEILYRRLGWLAAYALFIEPRIREEYENVSVEEEIILDRTPLWIAITPDRVLRHRRSGHLIYREYKTTLQAGFKWVRHWPYDIQIHLGIKAIEEEIGEKLAYGQVMGLMKGDTRGDRLIHPYVWAWKNNITGAWTCDYAKARSAAWEAAPVWDYPGGIVSWVQACGQEVAQAQFPHSAPCFLNERMLDEWVERRIDRARIVAEVQEECQSDLQRRNLFFEKRTRNCSPAFGDPCPYIAACWNAGTNENPLASGLYEERVPHHEIEIQFYKSAKEVTE